MAGPFYFALCGPGETFGVEHHRFDWRIISAVLTQNENGLATLDVIVPNPRRGLLNPDDDQWAIFARKEYDSETITQLFYGRIIGVPSAMNKNKIKVTFRAEPEDFPAAKSALAETLKNRPYYDKIWIDPGDWANPDMVLLARTANFHVDRVSHAVSISDNFQGEDGTINFLETDVIGASVDPQIGQPSSTEIICEGAVQWKQSAVGFVDVSQQLIDGFKAADPDNRDSGNPFGISSYTIDVLIENWPLPGDAIGGGWSVEDTVIVDGTNKWISPEQYANNLITMYAAQNPFTDVQEQLETLLGASINDSVFLNDTSGSDFALTSVKPSLVVRYTAERERNEAVLFTLRCDLQDVVSDAPIPKQLALSCSDLGDVAIDGVSTPPIGDLRRSVFFTTDRGKEAVANFLLRARATLLDDARSVHVSFTTRFRYIFDVTTRKNASIIDPHLPGGFAAGKIIAYTVSIDGNSGQALCSITIGCAVGRGNVLSGEVGTPDYVEEGYVDQGYQTYSDQLNLLPTGDVGYYSYDNGTIDDDGINLFDMRGKDVVQSVIVTNGLDAQRSALLLNRFKETQAEIDQTEENIQTNVCMNFKPVQHDPFFSTHNLTVSDIVVSQGINLEAEEASV